MRKGGDGQRVVGGALGQTAEAASLPGGRSLPCQRFSLRHPSAAPAGGGACGGPAGSAASPGTPVTRELGIALEKKVSDR